MLGPVVAVICVLGIVLTVLGLRAARRDRAPARLLLGSAVALELLVLVQAAIAVGGMVRGSGPEDSTALFVSYLITVVLVVPAAVGWALVERDRWSSAVVAVAGFTVTAMTIRLLDIWVGGLQYGAPGA